MKARVKATGEIWDFSQIDEITFKSAINGHLYCGEELEFLGPSVYTPDYWERLKHQYAGMAMQGLSEKYFQEYRDYYAGSGDMDEAKAKAKAKATMKYFANAMADVCNYFATSLVERMKKE